MNMAASSHQAPHMLNLEMGRVVSRKADSCKLSLKQEREVEWKMNESV